ncbi:MAG: Acyl-protein synthetase (LuxE) domain-containing protein [Candidatus Methanolliviera sp. GoM_oil]|nr:MAG: Acyl-protein synthetase (LuxE) domain-containing protein [Candidatus Methanolliviera sp. GoM_oil]
MKKFEGIIINNLKNLQEMENNNIRICFAGVPAVILPLVSYMKKKNKKFNFSNGIYWTGGGGWKTLDGREINKNDFLKTIYEHFGIKKESWREAYMAAESNLWAVNCEGHYFHVPSPMYPFVLDDEMEPLLYGSEGRFAFLDPSANSYPGFIVTEDKVKLLDYCPSCDRPGPVLAPEITRMPGAEVRGCAAAMAKVISEMEE